MIRNSVSLSGTTGQAGRSRAGTKDGSGAPHGTAGMVSGAGPGEVQGADWEAPPLRTGET